MTCVTVHTRSVPLFYPFPAFVPGKPTRTYPSTRKKLVNGDAMQRRLDYHVLGGGVVTACGRGWVLVLAGAPSCRMDCHTAALATAKRSRR